MHGPNAANCYSVVADQVLWKRLTGSVDPAAPGVAVHKSWLARNKAQAQALYAAYKQAVDWTMASPSDAARMISEATKLNARAWRMP
jgi:ABC-type nitrate/sulfonate/bicarbonate transport system substrate-binding protein